MDWLQAGIVSMIVLTSPVHALATINLQVAVGMIMQEFCGINTEIFVPLVQSVKSSIWVSHLL